MMELTLAEKVKIWQEATFQEIIASHNTHWVLQMPRRYVKTRLLRRLAEYYIEKGKDVYTMSHPRNTTFDGLNVKRVGMFIEDEIDITNVIFLIEGIHKWDPHGVIIPNGGMIVVAYTPQDNEDYRQKDREYRILTLLGDNL